MPAVIAENDVSIWDDETGAVYHYPRRYSAILKPGVQVVYYKGKLTDKSFADQRLSAQPHYFGIARIGKVYPDPESSKGDLFALIESFQPFEQAVLAKEGNSYLEPIPPSKASNYWRSGVREIGQVTFDSILARAEIKPLQVAESWGDRALGGALSLAPRAVCPPTTGSATSVTQRCVSRQLRFMV